MARPLTLTQDKGGIRLQTGYELGQDLSVTIDVTIPVVDASILELQAIACERAGEALTKWAQSLRQAKPVK
jgi:hypothetical protein